MRRNAQELRDNFKTSLIAALGRELDADTLRMATAVFKKRKFVDSSQVVRRCTDAWWCWSVLGHASRLRGRVDTLVGDGVDGLRVHASLLP